MCADTRAGRETVFLTENQPILDVYLQQIDGLVTSCNRIEWGSLTSKYILENCHKRMKEVFRGVNHLWPAMPPR
jgi:hypothetical protein